MTLALFVWLISLGGAPSTSAVRFECPYYSVEFARDSSTLVFQGVATAVELLEDDHQIKATIRVWKIWKGKPGKKIEVFYEGGSPNSGPVHLGNVYLFFARKMEDSDRRPQRWGPHRDVWLPSCYGVRLSRDSDEKKLGPFTVPD